MSTQTFYYQLVGVLAVDARDCGSDRKSLQAKADIVIEVSDRGEPHVVKARQFARPARKAGV